MIIRISLALFILLGICSSPLFAQTDFTPFKNQVKFSPFRLVDPQYPGVELSYERLHAVKIPGLYFISTQVSLAYMDNLFHFQENRIPKGFRTSIEEKLFLGAKKKQRVYGSFETVYFRGRYQDGTGKLDSVNGVRIIDTVSAVKQTFSFNVKFGIQYILHPVVIEFSAGLGYKYRVIKHYEKSFPDLPDYPEYPGGPWGYDPSRFSEGNTSTVNVPINFKIGFIF